MDLTRPSSWPRKMVLPDQAGHIEHVDLLVLQALGSRLLDDAQGQPFCDGGLATPASPMSTGLFLRRRAKIWRAAFDLLLPADDRVELSCPGHFGEVVADLVKIPAGGGGVFPCNFRLGGQSGPRTLRMSLEELMPAAPKTSRLSVGSASNPMSRCSVRSWKLPLCAAISDAWVKHILEAAVGIPVGVPASSWLKALADDDFAELFDGNLRGDHELVCLAFGVLMMASRKWLGAICLC